MNKAKRPHPQYGMLEPMPSAPHWDDPRSIEGRRIGLAWCAKCGATWNWASGYFTVPVSCHSGCFPVCRTCGFRMSVEEILECLERHDAWAAQFYPMEMPDGRLIVRQPMDLIYALDALMKWRAHGKRGEDPSTTCFRMERGEWDG